MLVFLLCGIWTWLWRCVDGVGLWEVRVYVRFFYFFFSKGVLQHASAGFKMQLVGWFIKGFYTFFWSGFPSFEFF